MAMTPQTNNVALLPREPSKMSATEYLRTRFTTLKPPMTPLPSPWSLLAQLDRMQWLHFAAGFFAWTWDAFDFFTVSMTLEDLAETFDQSKTHISWGITITLMFRSIGAILFGIASDRYGRKWPFVANNIMFIVLELLTGFCTNFTQFMVVRALYGVAMGGMWGNAAATALEDAPTNARGLMSGMLQQGYALGYLLAVVASRILVNTTSHGWRPLFWFGACPPVLIILFRLTLPETKVFQARMRAREATSDVSSAFLAQGKVILKRKWMLLMYMIVFMAAMSFLSHGSQDLYPTMLKNTLQFNADQVTVVQVTANVGAIIGGSFAGYISQKLGRRFSIMAVAVGGGIMVYPYTHTHTMRVTAAAFFMQACVQGALGIVPVHLMELSPPGYSTFISGTTYQLGNLIASSASTIEASLAESYPLPPTAKGDTRYEYNKVIGVMLAMVLSFLFVVTFLGPEKHSTSFEEDDTALSSHESVYHDLEKTPVNGKSQAYEM